jgi:UDP-N-acetylglucosamine transferase subunit ALG13
LIFVTVGTHQQPFDRLIRALDALPAEELVIQYGYAEPPRGVEHAVPFMSFPEMLEHFDRADSVITHGGVGSILCATAAGHVPIVVPRLKRHGEHVDDHQVALLCELEASGDIAVVWDTARLAAAVAAAPSRRPPVERGAGPLQENVRAAMRGCEGRVGITAKARTKKCRYGSDAVRSKSARTCPTARLPGILPVRPREDDRGKT